MKKDGTIESFVEYAHARVGGIDILWRRNGAKVNLCHSESAIKQAIRDKLLIVKQDPETLVVMVDWDNKNTYRKNSFPDSEEWTGYEEFTLTRGQGELVVTDISTTV